MVTIVNLKTVKVDAYDEVWAIVRSYKKPRSGVTQRAELSPSWGLFNWYRKMVEQNKWGREAFEGFYAPTFKKELKNPQARAALNELWLKSKQGLNIAIGCFCDDYKLCHRRVIAEMLLEAGCEVKLDTDDKFLELILETMRDGKRLTDMLDWADAEYDEYFDAEEHEYKVRAKWSFETKRGMITVDSEKGTVELEGKFGKQSKYIDDDIVEKLGRVADHMYSWEPERIPTTREKLNGVACDGGKHSYYVEYWDAMMERLDGEFAQDESWRDETIDYRKVVNEDWVAGCGDYVTKFMRDAYGKTYTTDRKDEPEIHVRKSYELRQFEALQEKQKREDPRKIWATPKQTPSWMPSYKTEEPAVKSGVTVKWVD